MNVRSVAPNNLKRFLDFGDCFRLCFKLAVSLQLCFSHAIVHWVYIRWIWRPLVLSDEIWTVGSQHCPTVPSLIPYDILFNRRPQVRIAVLGFGIPAVFANPESQDWCIPISGFLDYKNLLKLHFFHMSNDRNKNICCLMNKIFYERQSTACILTVIVTQYSLVISSIRPTQHTMHEISQSGIPKWWPV